MKEVKWIMHVLKKREAFWFDLLDLVVPASENIDGDWESSLLILLLLDKKTEVSMLLLG